MKSLFERPTASAGVCLGLVTVLLGGCSRKVEPDPDVLARVGSAEIRTADLLAEVGRLRGSRQAVPEKDALLQQLARHEALVQRARAAGLDQDPQLRRELNNLLIGALLERELAPKLEAVTVSPEELRAEYEAQREKYQRSAKVRLAVLQLQAEPRMSEARRTELRERLREARRLVTQAGSFENFGKVAVDYSDDQVSRYRGGDIGWLDVANAPARWPREVWDQGCALPKGQVSEVIETATGFYLVAKTDYREAFATPFAQVEGSLKQSVLLRKRRQVEESFRAEAAGLAGIQINTNALERLQFPVPPTAVAQRSNDFPPVLPGENLSTLPQ